MDWRAAVRSKLTTGGREPDDDVIEELAQHARAEYDAARAEGFSGEQAARHVEDLLARWRSDAAALQHRLRRSPVVQPPPTVSSSWFAGIGREIRYAARLLRRQPRYSVVAILTMALGIGATTLLFSVSYGVLMQPLPWPHAERLVVVKETRGGNPPRFGSFSNAAYLAWAEQSSTLESLAAWIQRPMTMTGMGDPERILVTASSSSLFAVLGARPLIGSFFQPKDESVPVVVISESLWRQRFGADPGALGRAVTLDGQAHTIVGVLPERQAFPNTQSRAFVPFAIRPAANNLLSMFDAVASLKDGVTPQQAAEEGTARGRFASDTGLTTMAIFGNRGLPEISAEPFRQSMTADVRRPLILLLSAVGLLLFAAAGNVASLQLARATGRQREIAIRTALGAGTGRVTRQLLFESLLVSCSGGALGLAVAWTLHRFLPTVMPADFPRLDSVSVNGTVIFFAFAIAVLTGTAFGLVPALRVRRLNLVSSLTEDALAPVGTVGRSLTARVRTLIMAGQVAIACVLLVGAALLGRSFVSLLRTDRGYDPSGVLTARVSFPSPLYAPERRYEVATRILERIGAVPGVARAAFTSEIPLTPGGSTAAFTLVSPKHAGPVSVQASPRLVSPGYFPALGMRIIAGRGFLETDTGSAPPVAVVNRAFARRFLGDDAVGVRMPMGVGYQQPDREATIVGVIDDVRYVTAADATQPEIYYSYRQFNGRLPVSSVTLMVRAVEDPLALTRPLRTAVGEADSSLAAERISTLEDRMLRGLARPRLYAIVLGGFAVSALVVAAVGLFGVLSYTLAQRTREIAVRAALGARRIDIVTLVVGQTLGVTAAGIAIGLFASMLLTRFLATLLHGVRPHDVPTFVAVPIALLAVAIAASLPPAIRAAKADPLKALRS